jgi:hypothetical protein
MSLWRARVKLRQLNGNINSLADPLQERVGKYAVSKTFKPEIHRTSSKADPVTNIPGGRECYYLFFFL